MVPVVGLAVAVLSVLLTVVFWIDPELQRVRRAIRNAEPEIGCTIGTYAGSGGAGLHAAIHNRSVNMAHSLRLTVTSVPDAVWQQAHLAPGDWARPQIPVADDAPLRTEKLDNPTATLRYADRYGHDYSLRIELIQNERDDGRFNLGSDPTSVVVEPPALRRRALWRLRTKI